MHDVASVYVTADVSTGDDDGEESVACGADGLAAEEEREYGKVARRVYLSYLRASGPCLGAAYLLSALAWQACRVLTDYWLSAWTGASPEQPPMTSSSPAPSSRLSLLGNSSSPVQNQQLSRQQVSTCVCVT